VQQLIPGAEQADHRVISGITILTWDRGPLCCPSPLGLLPAFRSSLRVSVNSTICQFDVLEDPGTAPERTGHHGIRRARPPAHPGGQVRDRPPSRCAWTCGTSWPAWRRC